MSNSNKQKLHEIKETSKLFIYDFEELLSLLVSKRNQESVEWPKACLTIINEICLMKEEIEHLSNIVHGVDS